MSEFLDNLRSKPEHVRKRIALVTTLAVFFVIVNVWWVSKQPAANGSDVSVSEVVSPLGMVGNVIMSAKNKVENFKTELTAQLLNASATPATVQKNSASDIVYPEQIFGNTAQETAATGTAATSSVN